MTYTGPMRLAHRGVAQKAPENTEGAFQAAVDEGYEGIELDIRLSKDGEVAVCYDSHFARLTCGHPTRYSIRHLADMTWEELSQIELPYALHLLPEEICSQKGAYTTGMPCSRRIPTIIRGRTRLFLTCIWGKNSDASRHRWRKEN